MYLLKSKNYENSKSFKSLSVKEQNSIKHNLNTLKLHEAINDPSCGNEYVNTLKNECTKSYVNLLTCENTQEKSLKEKELELFLKTM